MSREIAAAPARNATPSLFATLTIAFIALVVMHVLVPETAVGEIAYLAVVGAASVGAAIGAWRRVGRERTAATLVAVGIGLTSLGDLLYYVYGWVGLGDPDVSLADGAWLGAYVALATCLFLLLGTGDTGRRHDVDGLIDMGVVGVAGLVVVWHLSLEPTLTDSSISMLSQAVWSTYPLLDAVLLALVIRVVLSGRARATTGALLAAGVTCWLVADFAYMAMQAPSGRTIALLDIGWMVGAVLLALATWDREHTDPAAAPAESGPDRVGVARVALAIAPLLVPVTIAIVTRDSESPANPIVLMLSTVVLTALVFARGIRLLRSTHAAQSVVVSRERYYRALAANSSDAVIVIDGAGRILPGAPRLPTLFGLGQIGGEDVNVLDFVSPMDGDSAAGLLERSLAAPGQIVADELRVRRPNGSQLWVEVRGVNLLDDEDVGGIILTVHDVTDRKRAEAQLSYQAFHDSLTGLANRALLLDRADQALRRVERTGLRPIAIYLDLDGFKTVNDSLGHEAGDALLREVARRLLRAVREGDTVARLGGDEFAILVEQSADPLVDATALADRVLEALALPLDIDGRQIAVSASLGIAPTDDEATAASLLRNADMAMYQAKAGGRARWVVYQPDMRSAAVERMQLEMDMVGALDWGQFHLVYQPVIDLDTDQVVGFEALLRWQHPALGIVPPDKFISIAERNGLIVPLGRWVLDAACHTAARWQRQFPHTRGLSMAVNVSARQLADPDFINDVAASVRVSGIDPSALVLEMTETSLVQDALGASRRLQELHALGVRLAIDDFGTGYSSLSYLRQFPVDILKIDRSFISTITERNQMPAIVRGLLELGRTLQLEIIAEGIELDIQRHHLREASCRLGQGFLFARPLLESDAELYLASSPSAVGDDRLSLNGVAR